MAHALAAPLILCLTPNFAITVMQAVLLVSSVAHQLIRANELNGRDWKIVVIDDPSLNAFVTPGGMVCVFSGLLSTLRTRDQLAAVIAHEMGHAIARHAHESITASLVTTEIVMFLTLVLGIPFSALRMAKMVSPDSLRFDLHHSRYQNFVQSVRNKHGLNMLMQFFLRAYPVIFVRSSQGARARGRCDWAQSHG